MGHAKAIATLDEELQLKALKRCVKKSLSVRQAEMLAKKMSEEAARGNDAEAEEEYPESYSRLVVEFERVLAENIAIKRTKSGTCRITIECASDKDVEKLITKLGKIK